MMFKRQILVGSAFATVGLAVTISVGCGQSNGSSPTAINTDGLNDFTTLTTESSSTCFEPKGPVLVFPNKHPHGISGGACINPADLAAAGYDTSDPLAACYQYTVDQGYDFFGLYNSQGYVPHRCCPKDSSTLDISRGFWDFSGDAYAVDYGSCSDGGSEIPPIDNEPVEPNPDVIVSLEAPDPNASEPDYPPDQTLHREDNARFDFTLNNQATSGGVEITFRLSGSATFFYHPDYPNLTCGFKSSSCKPTFQSPYRDYYIKPLDSIVPTATSSSDNIYSLVIPTGERQARFEAVILNDEDLDEVLVVSQSTYIHSAQFNEETETIDIEILSIAPFLDVPSEENISYRIDESRSNVLLSISDNDYVCHDSDSSQQVSSFMVKPYSVDRSAMSGENSNIVNITSDANLHFLTGESPLIASLGLNNHLAWRFGGGKPSTREVNDYRLVWGYLFDIVNVPGGLLNKPLSIEYLRPNESNPENPDDPQTSAAYRMDTLVQSSSPEDFYFNYNSARDGDDDAQTYAGISAAEGYRARMTNEICYQYENPLVAYPDRFIKDIYPIPSPLITCNDLFFPDGYGDSYHGFDDGSEPPHSYIQDLRQSRVSTSHHNPALFYYPDVKVEQSGIPNNCQPGSNECHLLGFAADFDRDIVPPGNYWIKGAVFGEDGQCIPEVAPELSAEY